MAIYTTPPGMLTLPIDVGGFTNHYSWSAGTSPNGVTVGISPVKGKILVIMGRMEILEAGPASLNMVVASAGQAVSAGRIVTQLPLVCGLGATVYQPQYLTVPGFSPDGGIAVQTTFTVGDTFGLVTTGSFSASQGMIKLVWIPR